MTSAEQAEARGIIRARAMAIRDLPWQDLDGCAKQTLILRVGTRAYRIVSKTFWELGDRPWETAMVITMAAHTPSGWSRFWPHGLAKPRGFGVRDRILQRRGGRY